MITINIIYHFYRYSVNSIEEKEKRTKTYEPQQYSNAVIGGHKVIDGYVGLQVDEGNLVLNLEP